MLLIHGDIFHSCVHFAWHGPSNAKYENDMETAAALGLTDCRVHLLVLFIPILYVHVENGGGGGISQCKLCLCGGIETASIDIDEFDTIWASHTKRKAFGPIICPTNRRVK